MDKTNLKTLTSSVKRTLGKNSNKILMGFGIAGMITTTVLAVRATPKAMILIEEEKRSKKESETTKIDIIKAAYKPYIPAIFTGAFSIACLIESSNISAKRTAAIAAAYKLSETALSEYKDAIIETVGEKKAKEIKDKIVEKRIENNPVDSATVVFTGYGETLCYDSISGRYFRSNLEKIKKTENEINYALRNDDYVALNYLYDLLGLEETNIGDDLGWNIDRDGYVEIEINSKIAKDKSNPSIDGQPCIVMDYSVQPKYEYYKLDY